MTHMAAQLEPAARANCTGDGTCLSTESRENLSMAILFVTMLIFLGGTFFMTHKHRIPLPYTVVLFLYGIVVGVVARWLYIDVAEALGSIPPELLFYIFLPVLIFEGSYAMNIHALRRVFPQVALLATVGVLINTALLAVPVKLLFPTWSWYAALLLGSLLSATDPVAVVALLKELGVDKCMTAMVDGEAVMNDGTAIILFSLLLPAARAGFVDMSPAVTTVWCMWLAFLPIALGPLFGFLQSFWLRRTNDGLTKACITVSVTYVSYYVAAEMLGTSGVLTLFFQGIFLSYYCPSLFPGREGNIISSAWEFLVHLGNTVLFSLVGVILVEDVLPTVRFLDLFVLVALYLAVLLSRFVMLEALSPVLNMFSYKFDQKRIALMVHAGLRGGVSATLAIAVNQEGLAEGVDILKITSGIVLLTLLVNASTSSIVVERLGFKTKSEYRVVKMEYAMELMRSSQEHALEGLKRDIKYRNASWMQVERFVRYYIRSPFTKDAVEPEENEEKMVNRMLMSAFKAALWLQRDKEVITETVMVQMGASLATLIERGELLDVRQMYWYHRHRGAGSGEEEQVIETQVSPSPRPPHSSTTSTLNSHYLTQQPRQLAATQPLRVSPSTDITVEGEDAAVPESLEEMQNLPWGIPSVMGGIPPVGGSGVRASGCSDQGCSLADGVTGLPLHHVGGDTADEGDKKAETNRMVNNLMRRLLPAWVVLAERFICRPGYFAAAHRRAQENAFVALLAVVKGLTAISPLKFKFIRSEVQAWRVERWMMTQITAANRAIRFFYANFPEATNNVASSRAVISVANALEETVHNLNAEHGFGTRATEVLEEMVAHMRSHTPSTWENNASQNESNLVLRAVAATLLGKGLRSLEIKAISSMGLVRKFREGDIITLPDNAFLVVVFGSLRAVYGQWTTLTEHEQMESFGDTVGLEALMLPQEFRVDQQRRWRVISTDSTTLIISFNSIKPFLTERSLRAVKALWRAAAAEVLMPFLSRIVTVPDSEAHTKRERLTELIMAGTPLIGPRDCDLASCETNFHLYFYLRGYDKSGLFNCHTPPCYLSIFYVHQLRWVDPDAVLYAVPMRVGDRGYVPWPMNTAKRGASVDEREDESGAEESEEYADAGASARRPSSFSWTATHGSPASVCPPVSLQPPLPSMRLQYGAVADKALPIRGQNVRAWCREERRSHHNDAHDSIEPNSMHSLMPHGHRGGDAEMLFTGDMEHDAVTPPALLGENSVATHAGAMNIINSVLLGCAPEDPDDVGLNGSISATGDLFDSVASPTVLHTGVDLFLQSPLVSERLGHNSAAHEVRDTDISIFYSLERFATHVPFANQMLVHYASSLEHLCIATLRYLRFPTEPFHARHAQSTGEQTVEFLLNFCVELSMLKRTCRIVSKLHEDAEVLHLLHVRNDTDSMFQARVCAWARRHRLNGKFHLKSMLTAMNQYANLRFPDYVSVLRRMVELEPGLKEVETAEGMNLLCLRILKSSKNVAVETENLEDAL
ncbi:Na/H antiporter-like protein [Leishmania tarentolae]|uniref:Na/H antiporter-like protein n=1 Tax=Leishmania tarentolae TaxID=5689 RepID=A0A640KGB1_LEITA|nr:Na/H antiporter-like protein [Leishmania tarentolae]